MLVYLDSGGQPWEETYTAWKEGRTAFGKARTAWEEILHKYGPQIESQIRTLIPELDTYWDGKQLVFPTNPVSYPEGKD